MAVSPRVITLDGRAVIVVDRKPPLPSTLEVLLSGGRDETGRLWPKLRVAFRDPLRITGASRACTDSSNGDAEANHRLRRWLEGFYVGSDGIARFLSLHACADCGAVCVRDRSIDELDRLPTGGRPLRRRDEVLGWYSGARPLGRTYT